MGGRQPSRVKRIRIDAHAAFLAARDPRCPWHARAVAVVVAAYALSPIDLIPDFIPVVGLLDDALLIPAGIWLFMKLVPSDLFEEHRAAAARAAERPVSRAGAAAVIATWLAAALLALLLVGCSAYYDRMGALRSELRGLVGRPAPDAIARFGPPQARSEAGEGALYRWALGGRPACTVTLTADRGGTIRGHGWSPGEACLSFSRSLERRR